MAEGRDWIRSKRREDALAKIRAFCGGPNSYELTDEVDRENMEASFSGEHVEDNIGQGAKHFKPRVYRHLFFECKP